MRYRRRNRGRRSAPLPGAQSQRGRGHCGRARPSPPSPSPVVAPRRHFRAPTKDIVREVQRRGNELPPVHQITNFRLLAGGIRTISGGSARPRPSFLCQRHRLKPKQDQPFVRIGGGSSKRRVRVWARLSTSRSADRFNHGRIPKLRVSFVANRSARRSQLFSRGNSVDGIRLPFERKNECQVSELLWLRTCTGKRMRRTNAKRVVCRRRSGRQG